MGELVGAVEAASSLVCAGEPPRRVDEDDAPSSADGRSRRSFLAPDRLCMSPRHQFASIAHLPGCPGAELLEPWK